MISNFARYSNNNKSLIMDATLQSMFTVLRWESASLIPMALVGTLVAIIKKKT